MQTFNPRLHGMRALAAIGVLLFHWAQLYPEVQTTVHSGATTFGIRWHLSFFIGFGWMGVTLFFVLSGFLLTSTLQSSCLTRNTIISFWRRRFLRIYPAVWLQIAIFAVLGTSLSGIPTMHWDTKNISNALLFINLPPVMAKPANPVWWTLPVELGFYLLLPLLVLINRRYMHWLTITLIGIAITICWRWTTITLISAPPFYHHIYILDALPGILTPFVMGFAIAQLPTAHFRLRQLVLISSTIIGYLLLLAINLNLDTYWQGGLMLVTWPSLLAAPVAGAVWASSAPLPGCAWLSSRPLVWLGHLSFGIYLWHYPCFTFFKATLPQLTDDFTGSLTSLALGSTATLILAAISYHTVERKAINWGRSLKSSAD